LPDGTLIFTDAMVNLSKEDDELLAIAAHEVGHIHYRHSLRHMIQSSILAFIFAVIAGDISGTSEVFLGIPVMLTELSYSREFEREADRYSFQWLKENNRSPLLFANIMGRLENAIHCEKDQKDCKSVNGKSTKWLDYFSTHPPTDERINRAVNGGGA
ncbi:M48 family metallopeptidase, partial [Kaarinaea lacus]